MKIENNLLMDAYASPFAQVSVIKKAETTGKEGVDKAKQAYPLKYSGDGLSSVNISTEIYANNIIKGALKNIKSGERIDENKRTIQIFASIVKADPIKIIYG